MSLRRSEQLNFLRRSKGSFVRKRRPRAIVLVVVSVVLLAALGWSGFARVQAIEAKARSGEALFRQAQTQALALDFSAAKRSTQGAIEAFDDAAGDLSIFRLTRFIPVLGTQISAADTLLIVARESGAATLEILEIADAALASLTENKELTPNALTTEERTQILAAIADGQDRLQRASAHLAEARVAFEKMPKEGLVGPLEDITRELTLQFPLIERVIDNALPFTQILPHIAGYPDGIRYLFLLQNNQELRPTGGFIGSFGILELQNGEIQQFTTDNVYTLDEAAEARVTRTPPQPLVDYLAADKWFFRDANWSPDFPTSAQQALELYREEAPGTERMDGVIAVTPVFIQGILSITGPITVDGVSFTAENVAQELRFQVDRGFRERGERGNDRKGIIGRLGQEVVARIENLPQSRWGELWAVLLANLEERHILIFLRDETAQQILHDRSWDGAVKATDGDFLHVNDANLASLKTDQVITRAISYAVDLAAGTASLEISYEHHGTFTSTITRYRTYTRIYVPRGSRLLSSEGFMTNDKLKGGRPTDAETFDELGKTVFAGFVSVEPGTTETVRVTYALPAALLEALRRDGYTLYVQKQAGVEQVSLTSTINLGTPITRAHPLTLVQEQADQTITFSTALETDAEFSVR